MPLPTIRPHARLLLATALTTLCLPAPAAQAESTTVTGIEIAVDAGFKLTVPSVDMEDSSLSEDTVRAIFAGDFAATAGQLSGLDAASIRIPEIRLDYQLPGSDGSPQATAIVYRDIEFADVVDGVAGSVTVGGSEVTGEKGVTLSFGRSSTGRFDIGGLLGFYGLGSQAGSTELRPIYSDFTFEGMALSSPDVACEIGAVRTGEFAARPVTPPLSEIIAVIQEIEAQQTAGEQPAPESVTKVVAYYLDLLTAFKSGPTEFDGLTCTGRNEDGKPLQIKVGPMTVDGFEPGVYPGVAVNDLRLEVENDGWMELGSFTLEAMDFTGAIDVLRQAASLDEAWFAANWRKLVPAFGGFSAAGFGMDVPDPDSPGQRLQASVGTFDVRLGDYVNGIPARIGLSASDVQVALPPDEVELAASGPERLDLDYDIALHWDEAASTIVVERFAFADATLGSVRVSGTLGNATADLFSEDVDKAAAASMGLTLKGLEIEIADKGMVDLLIARTAMDQGQKPVVFRAALSGIVQALPLAALGPSKESLALGAELRAFIDGKPNLRVTLTSRDPAGLGLAELEAAQQDPTVLSGKVTIVAEASGQSRRAPEPAAAPPTDDDTAADRLNSNEAGKQEAKRASMM